VLRCCVVLLVCQCLLHTADAVCAVENQVYELQSVCYISLLLVQPPHSAADAVCCCSCGLDAFDKLLGISTGQLQKLGGVEGGEVQSGSASRQCKHMQVSMSKWRELTHGAMQRTSQDASVRVMSYCARGSLP
jgi:hypothetical protein